MREKMKPWSMAVADRRFARWVVKRGTICQNCSTRQNLTCSHYFMRGCFDLRYEPDNVIALCIFCHVKWEGDKSADYKDLMVNRLGQDRYDEMERIFHRSRTKRKEAIERCREFLDGQYKIGGIS